LKDVGLEIKGADDGCDERNGSGNCGDR
jgi:hypothetical protein